MLFGAAGAIRRSIGAVVWRTDRTSHDQTEEHFRASLGDATYRAAVERGATFTMAEAVDSASRL
jgi:hypothetical protein